MNRFFHLFAPIVFLLLSSCSIKHFRLQMGAPNARSYKSFDNCSFTKCEKPYNFKEAADLKSLGQKILVTKGFFNNNVIPLEDFVGRGPTLAMTVIRNDSVIYEYYARDYDKHAIVSSFSVSKSFVSALLGVAIHEGYIKSVEEPITNYLPELDEEYKKIKIRHVLNHIAGIEFPSVTWVYYTTNNYGLLKKMRCEREPGTFYRYDNGNTLLITFIIERATGRKFQEYFSEKIWSRIGAENDMLWTIDSKKHNSVKTFCCINGVSRDFAKFGKLYLQKGKWEGEQIIPEKWIDESIRWDVTEGSAWDNEYFWWLGPKAYGYYYAAGLYGQYIIVYPQKNVIITRFARRNLHLNALWSEQIMQLLDQL